MPIISHKCVKILKCQMKYKNTKLKTVILLPLTQPTLVKRSTIMVYLEDTCIKKKEAICYTVLNFKVYQKCFALLCDRFLSALDLLYC